MGTHSGTTQRGTHSGTHGYSQRHCSESVPTIDLIDLPGIVAAHTEGEVCVCVHVCVCVCVCLRVCACVRVCA
jgi:hypothetical protein